MRFATTRLARPALVVIVLAVLTAIACEVRTADPGAETVYVEESGGGDHGHHHGHRKHQNRGKHRGHEGKHQKHHDR